MPLCLCIRLRSFLYPWAVIHRTCCHYLLLRSNKAKDCLLCTSFYWNGQEDVGVFWATLPECSAEGRTVAHTAGKASVLMESEPSSHGDVVSDEMRIQSLKYSPILMIHILITYKNKSLINTLSFFRLSVTSSWAFLDLHGLTHAGFSACGSEQCFILVVCRRENENIEKCVPDDHYY